MSVATMQYAATVVLVLAAAIAGGASMSALWLARACSYWARRRLPLLQRCALGGSVAALAALTAVLFLESASMAEVPLTQAWPAVQAMLRSTHYGIATCIGAAALAVAIALNLLLSRRRQSAADVGMTAALLVFWYTRSMVSHAAGAGDLTLAIVADWVHLALISLWIGEVFVAGLVVLGGPDVKLPDDRQDRARYIAALSTSATLALAGIFVTGGFAAVRNLGGIGALFTSTYGETLLAKLAVVGIAAMLGAFNRFMVMPDWLARENAGLPAHWTLPSRFRRILRVEAAVLLAALVIATVLAGTSPPDAELSQNLIAQLPLA